MFSTIVNCAAPLKYEKTGAVKYQNRNLAHFIAKILDVITAVSLLVVGVLGLQLGFGFSPTVQLLMAGAGGGLLLKEVLETTIFFRKELRGMKSGYKSIP